jgi:hypothetical protein
MPFRISKQPKLFIVCPHILFAVVGYRGELAVVLELIFQLGELRNDPFALFN